MWFRRSGRIVAGCLLMVALGATSARGQDGLGLRYTFGWQDVTGDFAEVLDAHVDSEFSILWGFKHVRIGAGANWVSFAMDDVEESWNQIKAHFLLGFPFQVSPGFRPYVEARYTFRRLRPEGDRYFGGEEELLGDFVSSGSGFEAVLGSEFVLGPKWAIDLSGAYGQFSTSPDLSELGLGDINSGGNWRVHAGITWFPVG